MNPQATPPNPPSTDMHVLLIIMGILILVLSIAGIGDSMISYLTIPHELDGAAHSEPWAQNLQEVLSPTMPWAVATSMIGDGLMLAGLIWLTIGMFRARRWSWKFAYSLGWLWMGLGLIGLVTVLALIPAFQEFFRVSMGALTPSGSSPPPTASLNWALYIGAFIGIVVTLIGYSIPGVILIVVFGLKNVRLTCEYRDPVPRWTDSMSISLLILFLLLASSGFYLVLGASHLVTIVGQVMPGFPAGICAVITLVLGVAYIVSAWKVAKREMLGWWIGLFATAGCITIWAAITLWLTPDQVRAIAAPGFQDLLQTEVELVDSIVRLIANPLTGVMSMFPVLAFLFWVRPKVEVPKPLPE